MVESVAELNTRTEWASDLGSCGPKQLKFDGNGVSEGQVRDALSGKEPQPN